MMIRPARRDDISGVVRIYEAILDREGSGASRTGWQRGVYPTEATALGALKKGELFVLDEGGHIAAAAKINREQVPEYAHCPWAQDAPDHQVMVIHTLVVDPDCGGKGYGTAFIDFYERYALKNGCPYLRMDTNETNLAARALYGKLGYTEPGIVSCTFNGIEGVRLVCLEKTLSREP